MRWISVSVPLSFAFLLVSNVTFCQEMTAVVEAKIISISAGPTYHIQIEQVKNGEVKSQSLEVGLTLEKEDLQVHLRRFKAQKWLMTLIGASETGWKIRAAFGLGEDQDSEHWNQLPMPLISDMIDGPLPDHARTLGLGLKEQEIVELTNQERWNNGMLPPYKQVTELHTAADCHSDRMAHQNFFAHCDFLQNPDKTFGQRITDAGYFWNSASENIAAGNSTSTATMNQWMGSSGHRSNILNTSRREIGVGYVYNSGGSTNQLDLNSDCNPEQNGGPYHHYWTQNFGRRNSVSPLVIERELALTTSQTVDLYVYDIYGQTSTTSMRFRNENGSWSNWMPYTPDHQWTLSNGNGTKTVYSQVSSGSNGSGTVRSSSDQIELSGNCSTMTFSNQTLSGSNTYTDCEIIADPNVMISGQIIFQASTVTLGQSVEVPMGATLDVQIQ